MKSQQDPHFFLFVMILCAATGANAADTAAPVQLRYALPPGKTNAYNLTITQQGESGRETVTGTLLVSTRSEGANFALSFRGQLHPRPTPGAPMFMGYRPGGPVPLNLSSDQGLDLTLNPEKSSSTVPAVFCA